MDRKFLGDEWTDILKICPFAAIGYSQNTIIYPETANIKATFHTYEDCSCCYEFNPTTSLYAIFDGHECRQNPNLVRNFASQLTASLYFAQLDATGHTSDDIKDILKQAFQSVESAYMQSIDHLLVKKAAYSSSDLPTTLNSQQIQRIDRELCSGATSAVALIHKGYLYVANVGTCRCLLVRLDSDGVLKIIQISTDHNRLNPEEKRRIADCYRQKSAVLVTNVGSVNSSLNTTRCLGDYMAKSTDTSVISAEPELQTPIRLDSHCRFLLLATAELFRCISEIVDCGPIDNDNTNNRYLAQLIVERFRTATSLEQVAQSVIDQIVRLHSAIKRKEGATPVHREDVTLILRNFNYPLIATLAAPTTRDTQNRLTTETPIASVLPETTIRTHTSEGNAICTNSISTNSSSSTARTVQSEQIGPNQRIPAYVDFGVFEQCLAHSGDGDLPQFLLEK